jgi:hypothetical protein
MQARILDLDTSLSSQPALAARSRAHVHWARNWGPRLRLACSFRRFDRFQRALSSLLGSMSDERPYLTWYGSGDFHHVTLALLRRLRTPFNLLVLDNHPDWMRRVPFLHCGTWLWHAAQLPLLGHIFHVGGDVDFDNAYRWLAPWPLLRSGKIRVLPAIRKYQSGSWRDVPHQPLRESPDSPATPERIEQLLWPLRRELAGRALYVSLDKDVLSANESVVNWDSGHLELSEAIGVIDTCWRLAEGRLAGMDIVGDWSPVRVQGWMRRMFHWTMHPPVPVDADAAARCNQQTNLELLDCPALRIPLAEGRGARARDAEVA